MRFARTIRFDAAPDAAERAALERSIADAGGRVAWGGAISGRTYALAETPAPAQPAASGKTFGSAIIALAVTPHPPEAFSPLLEALGGPGRPAGILGCERAGDELLLEWDPAVTPVSVVTALIDTELQRFHGSRTTRSLAPLPVAVVAEIAARGLGAPEIAPDRILETYFEAPHGSA